MTKDIKIYTKNAAYQKLEVLKTNRNKRHRYGEFFVEGVRNINHAREKGWEFSHLIYPDGVRLSGWARDMLKEIKTEANLALKPELMAEISSKEDTSELAAVVRMRRLAPADLPLSDCPMIALFDRPSNRGNLGTVIRSADALGIDGLIITGHAVDLYDPDTVASTMGSLFDLPVAIEPENAALIEWVGRMKSRYPDFTVIGTTAHRQTAISDLDLTRPCLLMVGNETEGLSNAFYGLCDLLGTIPMAESSGASSFNVACAATVLFYEAARQRSTRKLSL